MSSGIDVVSPKRPKPHKKMGRRPKNVNYKKLFELAALGMSDGQIADCLHIARSTFIEKRDHIPEFSEALRSGRAEGIRFHTEQIKKQARKGNYQATAFYLKSHGGTKWQDHSKTDARVTLQGNADKPIATESLVKVTFYMPKNGRDGKDK